MAVRWGFSYLAEKAIHACSWSFTSQAAGLSGSASAAVRLSPPVRRFTQLGREFLDPLRPHQGWGWGLGQPHSSTPADCIHCQISWSWIPFWTHSAGWGIGFRPGNFAQIIATSSKSFTLRSLAGETLVWKGLFDSAPCAGTRSPKAHKTTRMNHDHVAMMITVVGHVSPVGPFFPDFSSAFCLDWIGVDAAPTLALAAWTPLWDKAGDVGKTRTAHSWAPHAQHCPKRQQAPSRHERGDSCHPPVKFLSIKFRGVFQQLLQRMNAFQFLTRFSRSTKAEKASMR